MSELTFIQINASSDLSQHKPLLRQALPVHKQLRAHFSDDFDVYFALLTNVLSSNAKLILALNNNKVVGLSLYRIHYNTYQNKLMYIEDLVVDETQRGLSVGQQLLALCEKIGKQQNCDYISLDSGTHRARAHKFYFLQGFEIGSYHFNKKLD